ncbi:alginate biosynthesis regulator AlgR [Arenicella sp. 4NH20-0111]|uniref:LytR/AlgR family response regulator transcription factor n=1 Tax=Arenicella sp. 4NH20-0111 TaxID=3127648 RepID=UPI00310C469D
MQIRTLIVDDEPLARARMERLLSQIDVIDVVGAACDGREALKMVDELSPNLIFMDVQMPHMNGLDAASAIMERFEDDPPAIIFCTAFDQYAIDAFKVSASDYLLKPVSVTDLEDAIDRACLVSQLRKPEQLDESNFLPIKHLNYVEKRPMSDVVYFRSEGKHVVVGLTDATEVFIDSTLKDLEQKYFSKMVRVHRNSLLSRERLTKLVRGPEGDFVELSGSDKVFQVSRRMLSEVKKCFG